MNVIVPVQTDNQSFWNWLNGGVVAPNIGPTVSAGTLVETQTRRWVREMTEAEQYADDLRRHGKVIADARAAERVPSGIQGNEQTGSETQVYQQPFTNTISSGGIVLALLGLVILVKLIQR